MSRGTIDTSASRTLVLTSVNITCTDAAGCSRVGSPVSVFNFKTKRRTDALLRSDEYFCLFFFFLSHFVSLSGGYLNGQPLL